ncbi:MAG: hypothetical protein JW940_30405 [Polyangiaceae bacterium]|nr:hypothetical protein [Polyangiaceae bacterium]
MRRLASHLRLLGAVLLLGACRSRESEPLVTCAEFGVLFGGQVQTLDQIPFELDRARQTVGFRLEFTSVLGSSLPIAWELDMPCRARRPDAGTSARPGRAVRRGSAEAKIGRRNFEQVLVFEPSDMLGTWNIRVRAGPVWVIDRPFLVYDAEARRQANRADAGM